MNEADFITALRKLPLHEGARGLEDDCAVLEIGSETLVLTHDAMAEGTHFRALENGGADLADVAWKLVASNLSDLAAKGAEPVGVLLGHMLSEHDQRFLAGLEEVLREYNVPLLGGDTVKAEGTLTFGLTAIGRATHAPVPSRGGARAGDAIYVTGTLGRAMLGFEGNPDHVEAFNRPIPRIDEGRALAPHVTAMMDISDGLLLDCRRMAKASHSTFQLNSTSVPLADADRARDCMTWGDDYELLFTAAPDAKLPVPATCIGEVSPFGKAPLMLDDEVFETSTGLGFQHG